MPRRARTGLAGFPLHVFQRGNNRGDCFFSDTDRRAYLRWLKDYSDRFGVAIHAWVLMTNHVHLLLTPAVPADASRLMQALGRRYVGHVNHDHNRTGTLWEGRFRACPVHAESYFLNCMRYIELNPVRCGMVDDPGDYPWSSYRANALGVKDPLLTAHSVYEGLGATETVRQIAYRALCGSPPSASTLAEIRTSTSAGYLLSSPTFRNQLEVSCGSPLGPARRGRPKKHSEA